MDCGDNSSEKIKVDTKMIRHGKKLLTVSLIFYFLCSASVLLLPLSSSEGTEINGAGYALALMFWIGLAVGSILFFLSWKRVKDMEGYKEKKGKLRAGVINFFQGKSGIITDCILILSLAVTLIGNYLTEVPYFVTVIGMFLFLLTMFLHSVVNGRVWKYIHAASTEQLSGNEEM